jgi:hypothetical protein
LEDFGACAICVHNVMKKSVKRKVVSKSS